jgi:hypothetical protein
MLSLVPAAIRRGAAVTLAVTGALSLTLYVASQVRLPPAPPRITGPTITPQITPNMNPGIRLPVTPTLTPTLTPGLTLNHGVAPTPFPGAVQGANPSPYAPDENSRQIQDSLDHLVKTRLAHLPAAEKTRGPRR